MNKLEILVSMQYYQFERQKCTLPTPVILVCNPNEQGLTVGFIWYVSWSMAVMFLKLSTRSNLMSVARRRQFPRHSICHEQPNSINTSFSL